MTSSYRSLAVKVSMAVLVALSVIWLGLSTCRADTSCTNATNAIPLSWRCKPDGAGPFTYYKYNGDQPKASFSFQKAPDKTDFGKDCLQGYLMKFEKQASFATSSGECYPGPGCRDNVHILQKTTVPLQSMARYDNNDYPECHDLVFPQSAVTYPNGRRFVSVPEISCMTGFALNDKSPIFCDHTTSWIFGTFGQLHLTPGVFNYNKSCSRCSDPPPVANGKLVDLRDPTVAILVCDEGSRLDGANVVSLYNGSWSVPNGTCTRICSASRNLPNGFLRVFNITVNSTATLVCLTSYRLVGKALSRCLEDGNWSIPTGKCEEIFCPPLPNPENGKINNASDAVFSTRTFTCDNGYELQGTNNITCVLINENPVWLPSPPTCTPIDSASEGGDTPRSSTTSWISSSTSIAVIAVVAVLILLLCVALIVIVLLPRRSKRSGSNSLSSIKYVTNKKDEETEVPTKVVEERSSNRGASDSNAITRSCDPARKSEFRDEMTSPTVVESTASNTLYSVVGNEEKLRYFEGAERDNTVLMEDDYVPPGLPPSCPGSVPSPVAASTPTAKPDSYTMVDLKAKKNKRNDPALYANAAIQADIEELLQDPVFATNTAKKE